MATPHLSHLLPWRDLIDIFRSKDVSAVNLPTGTACGKIHARDSSARRKIGQRSSYITPNMICNDLDCTEENELPTSFGKRERSKLPVNFDLPRLPLRTADEARKARRFFEAFVGTIQVFAQQEEAKLTPERILKARDKANPAYVQACVQSFRGRDVDGLYNKRFEREYALMTEPLSSEDDLAVLLYLDSAGELNIEGALWEFYGGQAVGHGIRFLLYHLVEFYFWTNMIAAAGYHEAPTKWGKMKPAVDLYIDPRYRGLAFRNSCSKDCDFYTFVPAWRDVLKDDVYIRDWSKTAQVLRKTFRFFVVCSFLFKRHPCPRGNHGRVELDRYFDETEYFGIVTTICDALGFEIEGVVDADARCGENRLCWKA